MNVSVQAMDEVLKGDFLSRENYRKLKGFDRKQMGAYLASFYKTAFEDGANAVEDAVKDEVKAKHTNPNDEYEEVTADWEDVLRIIGSVKGVGPALLKAIDKRMKEVM